MNDYPQLQHVSPLASNASALSTTATEKAQSAISFLDLPAEIRNMIYYHLFPEGRSAVQLLKRCKGTGFISMSDRLGIMATCSQIYEEAKSVLRSQHRLIIVMPKTLEGLLQSVWMEDEVYYDADDIDFFPNFILQHVIAPEGIRLDYDLDNRTLIRNTPGLLYTNQWLRNVCISDPAGAQISATLRTTTAKSTFQDFETLESWIKDGHANSTSWNEPVNFHTTIFLAFDISVHTGSEEVRLDATAFLRATRRIFNPYIVQVEVGVSGNWEVGPSPVTDIERRVLLFMWKIIQCHPERRTEPCPIIWVDEMLLPREAEFDGKNSEVRVVTDRGLLEHEAPMDLVTGSNHAVDVLVHLGDPDYSGSEEPTDFNATLLEVDFDAGSLLGVAADLARRIDDSANTLW
ncbi:uncharacterized protein M421DRAFT_3549 [Didymella exigua CBS 183.55]|uniref:F-box domain-containing protein n=1 Tax=Didymella exigua CBS 183.55 TaxID=1150837 RepID=A0A6A5RTK9_9PLEO|nr:uncharacterized protein M421DRAFT_3549 [Didymella exigua CBS 183.55]KAF1930494.1 hypothetical protein M421DRAFT_3549 [Didymella exigua CBS 183.55]